MLWTGLGLLALLLARVLTRHPEIAERLYGQGLFPLIRNGFDYTIGLLPFPVFWLILIAALWLLWRRALIPLRHKTVTWWSLISGLLSTMGAVLFLFYFLWGFNYARSDVASRMELSADPLEMQQLEAEFERATNALSDLTSTAGEEIRQQMHHLPDGLEAAVRNGIVSLMNRLDMPAPGRVRGRLLAPGGILLCFNTAGIYIPFSGEGHVDAGMLPMQVPFTMSHEMAHALGVTDEGDCNFLAFLACMQSEDVFIRYSGLLSYWRYVAAEYRRGFPEKYKDRYEQLPDLVRESLFAIQQNLDKYPEIMPRLRNLVYDSYLKSHGVHEGLKSYSRIVRLVNAYYGSAAAE